MNTALLVVNILALVYQFCPRLECYLFYGLGVRDGPPVLYLAISNNSMLGIYVSKIEYKNRIGDIVGPDLRSYRLCGNSDYCINIDCVTSVRIKMRHLCFINGWPRCSVTLDLDKIGIDGVSYRHKDTMSRYIEIKQS